MPTYLTCNNPKIEEEVNMDMLFYMKAPRLPLHKAPSPSKCAHTESTLPCLCTSNAIYKNPVFFCQLMSSPVSLVQVQVFSWCSLVVFVVVLVPVIFFPFRYSCVLVLNVLLGIGGGDLDDVWMLVCVVLCCSDGLVPRRASILLSSCFLVVVRVWANSMSLYSCWEAWIFLGGSSCISPPCKYRSR
jgi:hypothetical protein